MDEPEESYPPSHGEATKAAHPPKFFDQPEVKNNSSKDFDMQSTKPAAPVQPQPPLQREDQTAQQQYYTEAQTRPRITHPKLVASKAPCFPSAPFLFCEDEPIELPAAPCNSEGT
jgi:hypothetical protein